MGRTEVTQGEWKVVMGSLPTTSDYNESCLSGEFVGDKKPVICVNLDDAREFIAKLNAKGEGIYRVPTEAEWEYAARAGTTGDNAGNLDSMAWYRDNSGGHPHEVATKLPNRWGLYDMLGNVSEWTADWYEPYKIGSVTDPTGATSGSIVSPRGGGWGNVDFMVTSAGRGGSYPRLRYLSMGFRVVRN